MQPKFYPEPTRRRIKRHLLMSLVLICVAAILLPAAPAGAQVEEQPRRFLAPPEPGGATKNADLGIRLTAPDPIRVNTLGLSIIAVTNQGPNEATDIEILWGQLTDNRASAFTVESIVEGSGFSCQKFPDSDGVDAVRCTGGTINAGSTANILISVRAPNRGGASLGTEARVNTRSAIDTNPANNTTVARSLIIP